MSEKKTINLMIEDKTAHATLNFVLDTNTIRFRFGASDNKIMIEAVKKFFEYTESKKELYNFIVPWQVGSELRLCAIRIRHLQKDNPKAQEAANGVETFVKSVEEINCRADQQVEEHIRMLFEYLNEKYEFQYEDGTKLKFGNLKTDDARILLTALQEDRSLVTNNVRDFVPIFAFEKAIWEPVADKIYRVSPDSETLLRNDTELQNWIERILENLGSGISEEAESLILRTLQPSDES